eukprot:m.46459 g.46459  ORF g.46459 m.46459 type:complete len:55 (+) comp10719_c0_seq16:1727-1891(+)
MLYLESANTLTDGFQFVDRSNQHTTVLLREIAKSLSAALEETHPLLVVASVLFL